MHLISSLRRSLCLLVFVGVLPAIAWASPTETAENPVERHLFAPERVMAHQSKIDLSAAQRQQLIEEVQALQSEVVAWQFEISEAVEELTALVAGSEIDEAAALAQATRVTELEARVKQRHLVLLIRIKNLLDPEQQERLQALR